MQQAGLLPIDTQRGSNQRYADASYDHQEREIHVQRYQRERTARQRNTANFPETFDRKEQIPTQHRLFFRQIVS